MTEFVRELRYIVFKIKDIERYLDPCTAQAFWDTLSIVDRKITYRRGVDGKLPFNALVIEQDWPEFEPAWAMIEERMKKEQP